MVEKSAIIKVYKGYPLFCGMNPPEPPPIFPEVNGRYPHYEEAVIVTAGMHGGRGGMGKLFMPFVGTHGFSCVDEARIHIGEVNGPGGNGGDAGSIFLYKIGRTNETPTWDATLKMEVNGGDPGSNRIIRGPSANELSNIQGNICALHDQGKYQEGTRGAKGNIISQLVTPTKAVELVSNLLSIKDGRNDYVMDELAQRASTDRRVIAITFQEFMEKKFADELQEEQVAYIDDLMNYLLVDKRLETKSYNALHSFDLNSTPLQKLPNLYKILSEFQNFQPMNDNYNVEVLFAKTGGALKIDSLNRYNAFSKTVESIDSAKKDVTVNELKKLVGDAVDQLTQIKGSLFRTEFKQRGEELNSTLQSLIAATSGKDFLNAAPAIGRIISGAKDVIAGIGSENYAQVGTGLKQAYDGFQEFESLMRSNASAENQLKAVRQEITDLEMRVQSLAIEMAAARESAFANERDALADILDARSNLGWRRISRQKFFADLVKLSLTSYYLDTSRDELRLNSNLIAIRSLLTSSPSRLADFNFTLPSSDCTIATGIRCIEIDAQGIGGVIRLNKAASPALKLPLLIVSPDIERFIMDSFGAFTDRSQVNIAPSSN